jgi:hypothetical protein
MHRERGLELPFVDWMQRNLQTSILPNLQESNGRFGGSRLVQLVFVWLEKERLESYFSIAPK